MGFVFFNIPLGGFMKNEYSKGSNTQGNYNKGYQAATNKSDSTNRNPNAPTQGGFSTPGGGNFGQKDKSNPSKNPQSTNRQPNNTWGTGSINKTDKDSHR